MANTLQKYSTSSLKELFINLLAASRATQVLSGLFIKAPQQLNTTPIPFYKISFAIYSFLDKTPLTGAPILYRFVLQTKYKYLLSNSPKKIHIYHYRYNKLQAAMHKNFLVDKYRDSQTIVDLATSTLILNNINLAFMVLSTKKASLNIIIIGVKDPN